MCGMTKKMQSRIREVIIAGIGGQSNIMLSLSPTYSIFLTQNHLLFLKWGCIVFCTSPCNLPSYLQPYSLSILLSRGTTLQCMDAKMGQI